MECQILVATRRLGKALDELESALRAERVAEETVMELRLVSEEVLTNVARYGYDDDAEHTLRLGLIVLADVVRLEFRDDGRPFDPLSGPLPDLEADLDQRPVGGLGLHLVRSLVEAAHYARMDGANVLILTKRREGARDVP